MKKTLLFSLSIVLFTSVYAYDFSYTYSGKTLYYNIISSTNHTVAVTCPGTYSWIGYTEPTGSLSIPSSVYYGGVSYSVTSIGSDAFYRCTGLTSITIPNSVTSIGYDAFYRCTGLTSITIPNSVTSIGSKAFYFCSGLTSITIPNSVTSIGSGVFSYCSGLTNIIVNSANTVYDSRNNCKAIIETSTNKLIAGCKNTIIPNTVTSIGFEAFYGCSGLTSITIPNSVTSIGSYAFGCSELTSITIPNSVTSIGSKAFYFCSGLTSITIPNSVTSIGSGAFSYCSGLTNIIVNSANTVYDSRNNCKAIIETSTNKLIAGCKNTIIPNTVTSIGFDAFCGCSGLTSITIPNSVTSIGSFAFDDCSGLTSITIPNSVTSIGSYAFYFCSGLTSITIPNSVTSIGSFAFGSCSGLTSVFIGSGIDSLEYYAFGYCNSLDTVQCLSDYPPTIYGGTCTTFCNCGHTVISLIVPCNRSSYYSSWSSYFFQTSCINQYTLTAALNNSSYGTVTGAGVYWQGETATLQANPNSNYHFVRWNDNVTTNPRTVYVTSNAHYTAVLTSDTCIVNVVSNDTNLGIVSGDGTYHYGNMVSLRALPKAHCHFVHWSDNDTINPRTFTAIENMSLTAFFAIDQHNITASSSNSQLGTVLGGGTYNYGSSASLTAVPNNSHCHFTNWEDGSTENPRTVTVTGDASYTANFTVDQFNVSVTSANPEKGFVTGDGVYDYNSTATITAVPHNGYQFLHWSDGNTDATRSFTVTQDVELVAYFGEKQGIDIVEDSAFGTRMTIFPNPASNEVTIKLDGLSSTAQIIITDITGHKILSYMSTNTTRTISVSKWSQGLYYIKAELPDSSLIVQKLVVSGSIYSD